MTQKKQLSRQRALNGAKRKRDDPQHGSDSDRATKKSRPEQTKYDKTLATANPEVLASKFTESIRKYKGDLSTIELEDLSVSATCFRDTTSFSETRVVKNLADFLEQNTEGGGEELRSCEEKASPHTLIFASSAIRTTDLLRAVRRYGSEKSKIAKLFAKHMKLSAMIKYVQETRFGIGAGTPQRVLDLIKQDVLKLDRLKRIVIDASYVDEKQRTIFDEKDSFVQIVDFLNSGDLKGRLVKRDVEILVF